MFSWQMLYPILVLVGLLLSYLALRARYKQSSLNQEQGVAVGLAAFTGAMLGSKIPFLFGLQWDASSWVWLADGKTILGGIMGGYVAVELTKPFVGIKERTGDHFAIPIAIAVAFGRVGCFVSGCCFGQITDVAWGVHFPTAGDDSSVFRHPTQLYEAGFHSLSILVLLTLELRGWLQGRRLTVYLASYLFYRFVSEWIRPEPIVAFGLTAYQLTCIVMAALLACAELFATHRANVELAAKILQHASPTPEQPLSGKQSDE